LEDCLGLITGASKWPWFYLRRIVMRELINDDMYLISEIVDKMDLKIPDTHKVVNGARIKKTEDEFGTEIIVQIVKKLYLVKEPLNALLSAVLEKSPEEVKKMPLKESIGEMMKLFGLKEFMDFFKSAGTTNG
jgi:hypothetical protein